jgi:hypothetical protein
LEQVAQWLAATTLSLALLRQLAVGKVVTILQLADQVEQGMLTTTLQVQELQGREIDLVLLFLVAAMAVVVAEALVQLEMTAHLAEIKEVAMVVLV